MDQCLPMDDHVWSPLLLKHTVQLPHGSWSYAVTSILIALAHSLQRELVWRSQALMTVMSITVSEETEEGTTFASLFWSCTVQSVNPKGLHHSYACCRHSQYLGTSLCHRFCLRIPASRLAYKLGADIHWQVIIRRLHSRPIACCCQPAQTSDKSSFHSSVQRCRSASNVKRVKYQLHQ